MAKGTGIIGNISGKVGNVVGYNLKDSNNKQTQGYRAYQPVVRNPKTYAQAEQRARMAPINDFYRRLKPIIDRGQEGVAYGNKSRLRWLSDAMSSFAGPWDAKGVPSHFPLAKVYNNSTLIEGVALTKGSLPQIYVSAVDADGFSLGLSVGSSTSFSTLGALSFALLENNAFLKVNDQLTFVGGNVNGTTFFSVILNPDDTTANSDFTVSDGTLKVDMNGFTDDSGAFAACILSRQGDSGQHLRSTANIISTSINSASEPYDEDSKQAAIESYMAGSANNDWPQEKDDSAA